MTLNLNGHPSTWEIEPGFGFQGVMIQGVLIDLYSGGGLAENLGLGGGTPFRIFWGTRFRVDCNPWV
jgi:hypothetical protein